MFQFHNILENTVKWMFSKLTRFYFIWPWHWLTSSFNNEYSAYSCLQFFTSYTPLNILNSGKQTYRELIFFCVGCSIERNITRVISTYCNIQCMTKELGEWFMKDVVIHLNSPPRGAAGNLNQRVFATKNYVTESGCGKALHPNVVVAAHFLSSFFFKHLILILKLLFNKI